MNLGGLRLSNRLISAPMAGVSDQAFRRLVREAGGALAFPEMVSDKALLYGHARTWKQASPYDGERPFVVQLLGRDPQSLAEAAREAVERLGAEAVDINMGCPVTKVVRAGEGAALLLEPALCAAIVGRVARAVAVPVSCKIRLGWDTNVVGEVIRGVADAGAAFITVHARLRTRSYSTPADWAALSEAVAGSPVPVVGNGDVLGPEDAQRMLDATGCAAVMIGRGCLGNPWLFTKTLRLTLHGDPGPRPTAVEVMDTARRHLELAAAAKGERRAVLEMRRHGSWYIRGLPGAAAIRSQLMRAVTVSDVIGLLEVYRRSLAAHRSVIITGGELHIVEPAVEPDAPKERGTGHDDG